MSNISKAFENGKAFVAFITCGDPDLETTVKAVKAAADNGADLVELGIPFLIQQQRAQSFREQIYVLSGAALPQTRSLTW